MSRPRGIVLKLSDLPRLRALDDCYRSMVERVDRWRKAERNAGMLLAYGLVRDQMTQELRWIRSEIARLENSRGAGQSPAAKGHGCPASAPAALPPASAVGPAPGLSHVADITPSEDRFLFPSRVQELPPGSNRVDNQKSGSAGHAK